MYQWFTNIYGRNWGSFVDTTIIDMFDTFHIMGFQTHGHFQLEYFSLGIIGQGTKTSTKKFVIGTTFTHIYEFLRYLCINFYVVTICSHIFVYDYDKKKKNTKRVKMYIEKMNDIQPYH